jgi:hypothetical protein
VGNLGEGVAEFGTVDDAEGVGMPASHSPAYMAVLLVRASQDAACAVVELFQYAHRPRNPRCAVGVGRVELDGAPSA